MIQQAELAAPAAAEEQGVWSIGGGSLLLCGHGRPSICLPIPPLPASATHNPPSPPTVGQVQAHDAVVRLQQRGVHRKVGGAADGWRAG